MFESLLKGKDKGFPLEAPTAIPPLGIHVIVIRIINKNTHYFSIYKYIQCRLFIKNKFVLHLKLHKM